MTRRQILKLLAASAPALCVGCQKARRVTNRWLDSKPLPPAPAPISPPPGFGIAPGPFQPSWESLSAYQVPDWYRDAKLGIWAHWGPQCQPEMGDWYAQKMYQEGDPIYNSHLARYGHPSKFGFKDVVNEWKADQWDPDHLVGLYKKAGAKYFAALANHHDNLDLFDSTYQPWNSVAVGPKKNIIAGWEKAARNAGLKFAVSCHGDRAWSWYQVSQGADNYGEFAGVPYDGRTPKSASAGLWWDGLDPQDYYAQYHELGSYDWPQNGSPAIDKAFSEKYFNRVVDLINKHQPDLIYFDDTILPIYPASDVGLRIAAYFYNTNLTRNGGKLEAVMTGKFLSPDQRKALLLDVERGVINGGEILPWQTDTCIGDWHYDRRLFDEHRYKSAGQVIQMLIDIVSKNGNLMLSIPVRGNGTIDDDELKVVEDLGTWMGPNGEGIHATRPWKIYGEGPSLSAQVPHGPFGGAKDVRQYTSDDFRFTSKGGTLYAFQMDWPGNGVATIKSLAAGSTFYPGKIERVELLATGQPLAFTRDAAGLAIKLPDQKPGNFAYGYRISGSGHA